MTGKSQICTITFILCVCCVGCGSSSECIDINNSAVSAFQQNFSSRSSIFLHTIDPMMDALDECTNDVFLRLNLMNYLFFVDQVVVADSIANAWLLQQRDSTLIKHFERLELEYADSTSNGY